MNIVGMDLGGTQLRVRLCEERGGILAERKVLLSDRGPESVVGQMVLLGQDMLSECGRVTEPVLVSCAVAGMLDASGQIVRNAPNLQWRDVPLAPMIRAQWSQVEDVVLWNDLDAAAWGEYVAGVGRGVSDVAAVFVGSGVGGGLIVGGKPLRGANGVAGEIGHLKVVRDGRSCGCGGFGCMEAYAGGHSMSRIAREHVLQKRSTFLQDRANAIGVDALSPADIAMGVEAGDDVCTLILEQAADALGLAISHLITLVNPACLILGGGVLLHWPALQERTQQKISDYTSTPAAEALAVVLSQLGNDAGMVGTVDLALQWRR